MKNDDEQQRILIDILKHRYPKQHASSSSSSAVSTPIMPRSNSPHQRSSSTDPTDDESTLKNVGFTRGQRIRSSLPFIVKPALNSSKSNSLGLCFLICGNETKKVLLPAYISCVDTLKALFVRAFPQHLTMKHMDADDVRIYIREADKDLFYQLEDMSDVKDRAVLKVVQLNNNKSQVVQVPLKQQNEEVSMYVPFVSRPGLASEITYQRLSRLGRVPSTTSVPSRNGSIEEKPTSTAPMPLSNTTSSSSSSSSCSSSSSSSRSLSEPRRRPGNNENPAVHTSTPPTVNTTVPKGIISSPRSGSTTPTTPRLADDDARCKMVWMEKQLESLTELVKELTRERFVNEQNRTRFDGKSQSIRQKLYELKVKTHSLRNDLTNIRRMQQSMQDNFKLQIHSASKRIEEQIFRVHPTEIRSAQCRSVESELDLYTINSGKIDRDLEDLEASVEELQNDVKSKQCHVTMNDVESFALVLSTISRSLVDLKASFPVLREKICSLGQQSSLNDDQKFLHEEPERLDYTIKKCKRLTTMLYQLKRLAVSQEQKTLPMKHQRKFAFGSHGKIVDRKRLLEEIESATQNSDGRVKAIEKAERSRERRLYYTNQLEALKQMKYTSEQIDGRDSAQLFDTRSLTNSILLSSSTRTSICSTQSTSDSTPTSNNCPSPSLSFIVRQALISPTAPPNEIKTPAHLNGNGSRLQSAMKPPSKVTFCQQLITNGNKSTTVNSRDHSIDSSLSGNILINGNNKKNKPTPPPRLQSVSASSSAVSSAASCSSSSSSSSSSNGGNSRENRLVNGFCGIIPLVISPDRRHNGRCNSFSSSSTDTDSVISNPRMPITLKSPPPPPPPPVPSSSSSQNTNPTVMNSKPMVMPNGFHHKTTLMRASVTDL